MGIFFNWQKENQIQFGWSFNNVKLTTYLNNLKYHIEIFLKIFE